MLRNKWFLPLGLLVLVLLTSIAACGDESEAQGQLAPLATESSPRSPMTPTPYIAQNQTIPPVDWNKTDHFAAAMRPTYVGDVEPFINTKRYYIEAKLELSPDAAVISGFQTARYTNNSPNTLNEVVFRLYPNMPANAARMYVSNIQVNGQPARSEITDQNTTLWVYLDTPLPPSESVEIFMDFTTLTEHGNNLSSRMGYRLDQFTAEGWHPTFSTYETNDNEWWTELIINAIDPNFSETALYEVKMTRQKGIAMAISGVTIETTPSEDGLWETEHIVTGPMRYSYVAASPVMGKVTQTTTDGVIINTYFMPGGERAADYVLDIAVNSVEIFNRIFGDYPFAELDVVELNLVSSAIEYPGLIVLSYRFWENGNLFAEIATTHEVGHQWWFSVVGNDQVNHGWVDEGLTSYSEAVYMRERYGDARADDLIIQPAEANYANFTSNGFDVPVDTSAATIDRQYLGAVWYDKGSLVYADLERLITRAKVYEGIQAYFHDMKYGVAYTRDILRNMEEVSGEQLDKFFYEYAGAFEGIDPAVIDAENQQ